MAKKELPSWKEQSIYQEEIAEVLGKTFDCSKRKASITAKKCLDAYYCKLGEVCGNKKYLITYSPYGETDYAWKIINQHPWEWLKDEVANGNLSIYILNSIEIPPTLF